MPRSKNKRKTASEANVSAAPLGEEAKDSDASIWADVARAVSYIEANDDHQSFDVEALQRLRDACDSRGCEEVGRKSSKPKKKKQKTKHHQSSKKKKQPLRNDDQDSKGAKQAKKEPHDKITEEQQVEGEEEEEGVDMDTGEQSEESEEEPNSSLQSLLETDFTKIKNVKAIAQRLNSIADVLMNTYEMRVGEKSYRLLEVEAYLRCDTHQDQFTHGDDLQRDTSGAWYFHRQGKVNKTYKCGSFMGLDLTFGKPPHNVGGFLFRSMLNMDDGSTIEGPCNIVKTILETTHQPDIKSLVSSDGFKLAAFEEDNGSMGVLTLVKSNKSRQDMITKSPRYGLFLKKDPAVKEAWVMSPYRFISDSRLVKKQKSLVSLSLWLSKKDCDATMVKKITGVTENQFKKHLKAFEEGRKRSDLKSFHSRALKANCLVQLYGAWVKAYGSRYGMS